MHTRSVLVASALATGLVAAGRCAAVTGGTANRHPAPPKDLLPGQHAYSSRVGHAQVRYLLYAPAEYPAGRKRWPLIVFLHGSGERGTDPNVLTAQPLPRRLAGTTRFPAVVFSPQLPPGHTWWSDFLSPVDALVTRLEARYRIDPHRIYLTGLSLGGFGTWWYGLRERRRFAALVPIAGGYVQGSSDVPRDICALRTMPIWVFHGAADTVVYPYQSEVLVRALRRCGSRVVRFTLYTGVGHRGSWSRAYGDPALWRWLFAQRRP